MVFGVGDVDIAGAVDCESSWGIELRLVRRPTVAGIPRAARARQRPNGVVRIRRHDADDVVARVGHVELAPGPERDRLDQAKLGVDGRSAVAGVTGATGSCKDLE